MQQRYTTADGDVSTVFTDGDPDRTLTALRYIATAHPGEPLFCVRGRDLLAIPTATFYLGLCSGPIVMNGPVNEAVRADIAAMQQWQAAYPQLLKYPDRPVPTIAA